ncbi:Unknown protein [Striga hermonthica]|uniref:Uncharacterized protein n=1 Tax=Striga hermonthica TaxID=68872 RepID=A0A9N7N727_STRHE|nr:Unknown protein [Striga hermonthica]
MEPQTDATKAAQDEEKHQVEADVHPAKQVVQHHVVSSQSPTASITSSPEFSFSNNSLPAPTNNQRKDDLVLLPVDADDIFFDGHMLPLHCHPNHRSSSSSTNSVDSTFTLTLDTEDNKNNNNNNNKIDDFHDQERCRFLEGKQRVKSRSFSHIFSKWRKHHRDHDCVDEGDKNGGKIRKSRFNIVNKLVKPFAMNPFRHKRAGKNKTNKDSFDHEFLRQPASFNAYSGSLRVKRRKGFGVRGRRSEYASAPVSITTSPANSGPLLVRAYYHKSDSTVEELQAAIQAAIVHCKNSVNAQEEEKEQQDNVVVV